MDSEIGSILRQCSLFSKLDDSMINLVKPGCLWVRLKANDLLFHEGAPGGSLYIIVEGELAIERIRFREDEKEDVVSIGIRRPFEVIGEMSLFGEGRRTASVRATTDKTVLLMVDGRYVMQCVERSHPFAIAMLKEVISKLTEATEQQSEAKTAPVHVRLARLLLDLADAHGVTNSEGAIELTCVITQAELARRIGCAREVVNKHLKAFGKGAIEVNRGHITIHAIKRLHKIVERGY